jgi:hypothetical protein
MSFFRSMLRAAQRAVLLAFVILVAISPVPFLPVVLVLLRPLQRNLPAEMVKRRD